MSLKTKSRKAAIRLVAVTNQNLETLWADIRISRAVRLNTAHVKTANFSPSIGVSISQVGKSKLVETIDFAQALQMYFKYKGSGRTKAFYAANERAAYLVINTIGNKPLSDYSRPEALLLRDHLLSKNLAGSSISRIFAHINAIFNFAVSEYCYEIGNPFKSVYFDRTAGVIARKPMPIEDIRKLQKICFELDDDIRWLVAIISDTGMRLGEAAGLAIDDFIELNGDVPFVRIRNHPWRRLKTTCSEREIPLVGSALWAAKRIQINVNDKRFAFPRYNRGDYTSGGSASASINKWMKCNVSKGYTVHSLRHSLRDRLRAVECPSDMIDQIGGWTPTTVGYGYGDGYPMNLLNRWMMKILLR